MKKTIKALKFPVAFLLIISLCIACDKEFNVIESDVLGGDNANFITKDTIFPIAAYNKKLDSLQVNTLNTSLLGVYNDPAYGQTKSSIITQITPTAFNPDFGEDPVIDEVIINIPYFSTINGIDDDGNPTYKLDSLYGNPELPIKLTIYQSNYFLRDFDPNGGGNTVQNYYSNANSNENTALNGTSVIRFDEHIVDEITPIYEDIDFIPSNDPIVITTGEGDDAVTTRSEPAFREALDNDFWKTAILDKEGDPVLSNANNFRNYFRGLYFKAESITTDGTMILLNLAATNANITITYTKGPTDSRTQSTYTFNFAGNRLNTFINNYDVTLEDGDKDLGDATLYLKGTQGSMAVVDLFSGMVDCDGDGNVDTSALDCFKNTYRQLDENGDPIKDPITQRFLLKRLINEAHLAIYEDEDIETGGDPDYHKYDRIYAYDIKNNASTIDYIIDPTGSTTSLINSKVISLGQRNDQGKYKIRLTEHLNNILQSDSTNTKIGLALSTNVNYTDHAEILESGDEVTAVPAAAVLSPRGTILYGSNEAAPADKRLKLKIFFTEPK
ncbi:DUF4270 domain-containing protein [Tamlana sp. 2201CG12-4]|uniref:DUF4270 domain-containing protein n=1 Tax=Tamlana sp. 2201CG12-4 TaxID=3112582 RepID=UPI002DBD82C0|nr:DUF4270 domain-containing protein [Tamlana sp. 2201CG12-4]MEC3906475.1 DUF4270 domain-containing protein [Tamlana sp. 2201CG12-4]